MNCWNFVYKAKENTYALRVVKRCIQILRFRIDEHKNLL